jgi:hypothetical protein
MEGGRSGSGRIVRWVLFLLVVVGAASVPAALSCAEEPVEAPLIAPGGGAVNVT